MTPELLAEQSTVRPTNYFGPLYEYLDEGYGRVYAITRDADYIERSNMDVILEHFNENFADGKNDTWMVDRASHWACGWVDELLVKIKTANGDFTPEFLYMTEVHNHLEDYPILDEMKASEYEWNENHPDSDDRCYSDDPDCGCGRVKA